MTPTFLLTLPEIHFNINAYLLKRDQLTCALVGKQWKDVFLPYLWYSVSFKSLSYNGQPKKDLQHAIQKNGGYIRHLQVSRLYELQLFQHHCHHLSSLTMRICSENDWPVVLEVVQSNPFMISLSLTVMASYSPYLIDLLDNASSLKTFDLALEAIRQGITPDVLTYMLRSLPQLQQLSVRANAILPLEMSLGCAEINQQHQRQQQQQITPSHRLRDLRLAVGAYQRANLDYVIPHLAQCPNLEAIQLPALQHGRLEDICQLFQHHLRHVTTLDLSLLGYEFDDDGLARILGQFQPATLKTVSLQSTAVGEASLEELLRHQVTSLESLDITKAHHARPEPICHHWIQAILLQGIALREFKCGARGAPLGTLVDLEVAPLLTGPAWRCSKLQVLQLPLMGCRRCSNMCTHDKSCRAVQEQLYQQLGRLRELVTLDLGIYRLPCTHAPESNCLEWSLAAGLHYLGNLTKLETFSVVGVKHIIAVDEVRWMHVHWPRLRKLVGLTSVESGQWIARHWSQVEVY